MVVIKRNGVEQKFDVNKITNAVKKANNSVEEDLRMNEQQLLKVVETVQKKLSKFNSAKVEDIQDMVEAALVKHNKYEIAKAYIIFRQGKKDKKKFSSIEENALAIISGESSEARGDNANKHIDVNSSTRDYLAGIVCKSLAEKTLPKELWEAHKKGLIHWHDADYYGMKLHNCDLINLEEMLNNGFMMGDTWIDKPKRFSTACNLAAQISLIVSGSQYGGQTITWAHLLPFVKSTIEDCKIELLTLMEEIPNWKRRLINSSSYYNKMVEKMVKRDIHVGIKTYQYQILCHHSSNGQTPFCSNVLCLREASNDFDKKWLAFIIEEILKRRIKGVKDKSGQYVSPLFPKLLYWECEGLNLEKRDPYYYLTKLAAKCISIRNQPDINSEKKSREIKSGQIISSMGCRSWLSPVWEDVEYPINTAFYWQKITSRNIKYNGAYKENINYNNQIKYSSLPKDITNVAIDFNGNTGWPIRVENDKVIVRTPKTYGRWNNGVITVNLPYIAMEAREAEPDNIDKRFEVFYNILNERLELVHEGLKIRNEQVRKIKAKNSPILWMYGGLYRNNENPELTVGEIMDKYPDRPSISVGYVGLFETCIALIGESNTTKKGIQLSKEILIYINKILDSWKEKEHLGYSLYGTPEESLTYKFALAIQKQFGQNEVFTNITNKDYIVNSYHVDPREEIDAFSKLKLEGEYIALTKGGAVSYVETGDLTNNIDAILSLLRFMYDNIAYAEINRIIGVCYKCGYQGTIPLSKTEDGNFKFTCPKCGNSDDALLNVVARICGYLGKVNAGETNRGRLDDIYHRVIHLE